MTAAGINIRTLTGFIHCDPGRRSVCNTSAACSHRWQNNLKPSPYMVSFLISHKPSLDLTHWLWIFGTKMTKFVDFSGFWQGKQLNWRVLSTCLNLKKIQVKCHKRKPCWPWEQQPLHRASSALRMMAMMKQITLEFKFLAKYVFKIDGCFDGGARAL